VTKIKVYFRVPGNGNKQPVRCMVKENFKSLLKSVYSFMLYINIYVNM